MPTPEQPSLAQLADIYLAEPLGDISAATQLIAAVEPDELNRSVMRAYGENIGAMHGIVLKEIAVNEARGWHEAALLGISAEDLISTREALQASLAAKDKATAAHNELRPTTKLAHEITATQYDLSMPMRDASSLAGAATFGAGAALSALKAANYLGKRNRAATYLAAAGAAALGVAVGARLGDEASGALVPYEASRRARNIVRKARTAESTGR